MAAPSAVLMPVRPRAEELMNRPLAPGAAVGAHHGVLDGPPMPQAYVFTAHGGPEVEAFLDLPRPSPGPGQLVVAVRARARNRAVLDAVAERVAAGALRPLVTSTYPLHRAPEALRLVEQGHARGKVVIEVAAG